MTLYFIGIGLNDEKDISVKGFELVKKADVVYLENYTSKINCNISYLEELYGKKIVLADRKLVEMDAEKTILENAKTKEVAFLVVGDVFSATTHMDLYLRAKKMGIKTGVVHNASVLTAVGITGLQLYKFGKVTSIPIDNENVETPYDVLKVNQQNNMHTLFILDLKEGSNNSLSVNDAIRYLLKVEMKRGERVFTDNTLCVGCVKLGSLDQIIKVGKANELLRCNFKNGMHCLIVPGKMHFMEEGSLKLYQ
ncbi:diphthine synthase [Candidatus Woesearchaeota archaeon]|jgi:diphthine synthase|nr:diphthine synthase [Candidatus Woesearchaeota archaeon]|tara:strand:+ start:16 stop:771 length:756 start_codon:yes stop_codon:yes gene_type:complete